MSNSFNATNDIILASALTSLLGTPVITQLDKNLNENMNYQTINPFSLHNSQLVGSLPNDDDLLSCNFSPETGNFNQGFIPASQSNIRSSLRSPRTYTLRYAPYVPPVTRTNNLQQIPLQNPQRSQNPQVQQIRMKIPQIQQIQTQIPIQPQIPQVQQIRMKIPRIQQIQTQIPQDHQIPQMPIPQIQQIQQIQTQDQLNPQRIQMPIPQIQQIQQIQTQDQQNPQQFQQIQMPIPQNPQIQQIYPQIPQVQQIRMQIPRIPQNSQQIQSQIPKLQPNPHQIQQIQSQISQIPQIQQISQGVQYQFPQPSPVININVNTLSGQIFTIADVPIMSSISEIKICIENKTRIPRNQQKLTYLGVRLENDNLTLRDYQILDNNANIYLIGDNGKVINFIDSNFLDPKFDYDFTNIKDDKLFMRGSHVYRRPCGWKRIAIRVLNKYGPDNSWLGQVKNDSWRYESDSSEWPVSYHGTNRFNAKSIAETGFDITKGRRFRFGYGIYSTPDINVAYLFASRFVHNNEIYCLVFQNRVNPMTLKKTITSYGEYWISPKSDDIRPYGICIKKLETIRN
ncbi:1469_t:CDS:1 [Funneliformis caledonium]|uniref:1469_t:CDS:1 n=1 Tax=Funneliformis caledonium TaxID=1117310 RepID=A0A9N9BJF2_9GLOM|nr:1469_t:CDS:1 [Funneliformis caledonium]